jgi:cobalamin biosynthesis protein CobW
VTAPRVPALVVSGFLGSGKTTLVRRLLAEARATGVRVAVVSNEFGELGIDQALLGDGEEAYVELDGGCVCCKLSDELQQTLQMLYDKVRPDRVIVETSGVALPFETQLTFWRPPVSDWVGDDAAVVVVNAGQLHEGRDLDGTFEHQVSSADLLLLNQVDTVPEAALPALRAQLEALSPGTPVIAAVRGEVSSALLFPPDPEGLRARRRAAPPGPRPHTHEVFDAEVVEVPAGLSAAAVEALLREHRALRIKGFVDTDAGPRLVQGVGRRLEVVPPPAPVAPELLGRVVVITRGDAPPHHHHP